MLARYRHQSNGVATWFDGGVADIVAFVLNMFVIERDMDTIESSANDAMDTSQAAPTHEGSLSTQTPAITSETIGKIHALTDELTAAQRSQSEEATQILDKAFKINENGASFYEKLILFNVGTIALSLTLLGQIVAHISGGHVPRLPFVRYLCPSWLLLLVSVQCCAQRIIGFHNANTALLRQTSALLSGNHMRHLAVLVARMSALVGQIKIPREDAGKLDFAPAAQRDPGNDPAQLADVFSKIQELLGKACSDETGKVNKVLEDANRENKKGNIAARVAIFSTTVALVLMCVFAIKSILGM